MLLHDLGDNLIQREEIADSNGWREIGHCERGCRMNFENAILSEAMPVNALVACNRIIKLLEERGINNLLEQSTRNDWRTKLSFGF